MYNSLNHQDAVIFHRGYAIYRNNHGEFIVENVSGRTIDLVFYNRSDAINWINSVS